MTLVPFAATVAAVLGLAVGSFLNVVIYRVPRQESIVKPGSHCPSCDVPIKGRHNVPLASYLVLRGRCHSCRSRISPRYPLVEAGTAILFAAITVRFGVTLELPAFLYLAAIGVALAGIDLDGARLPDSIVLPSYVVGVLLLLPAGATQTGLRAPLLALAGMVALLVLFLALAAAYPSGLSFGEVKLAGLIGLYLGWLSWSALFITAIGSLVLAAATGLTVVATRNASRYVAVPLASCLIGAGVLSLFLAAPLSGWYAALLTT
jgi:leader peptidase (prepilin peptidase)/N-methyltransferase